MPLAVRLNDLLGVAVFVGMPARRIGQPSAEHQKAENRVEDGEDPGRGLVEDEPLNPVLYETLLVAGRTRLNPKPGLQGC